MLHADLHHALARTGDPEADALVETVQRENGDQVVFGLMGPVLGWDPSQSSAPPGVPQRIADFLLGSRDGPAWLDHDRVRRAQRHFHRHRNAARAVLAVYSLPSLYVDTDIALALIGTGRLAIRVRDRLENTQAFVDGVMAEGALEPGGDGWRRILQVRLNHALRRAAVRLAVGAGGPHADNHPLSVLRARTPWQSRSDVPIDQLELGYVLLTFSWVVVDGIRRLGYPFKKKECDAYLHTWAAIGAMLGIDERLLPGGPHLKTTDAPRLFEHLRAPLLERGDPLPSPGVTVIPGVEEGRQLMATLMVILVDVLREKLPPGLRPWVQRFPWLDNVVQDLPRVLLYKLAGTQTARMLHVTPAPLLHWIICRIAVRLIDLRKLPT